MSYQVINPFIQFVDPINGKPLSAGEVYFGRMDSDPKNQPANRINVYAVQDNGSEVLLSQPITLNGAGQPQYSGSVKQLRVELYASEQAYAVQIFSKNGAQKGYTPRVYAAADLKSLADVNSGIVIGGVTTQQIADAVNKLAAFVDLTSQMTANATTNTTIINSAINSLSAGGVVKVSGAFSLSPVPGTSINDIAIARGDSAPDAPANSCILINEKNSITLDLSGAVITAPLSSVISIYRAVNCNIVGCPTFVYSSAFGSGQSAPVTMVRSVGCSVTYIASNFYRNSFFLRNAECKIYDSILTNAEYFNYYCSGLLDVTIAGFEQLTSKQFTCELDSCSASGGGYGNYFCEWWINKYSKSYNCGRANNPTFHHSLQTGAIHIIGGEIIETADLNTGNIINGVSLFGTGSSPLAGSGSVVDGLRIRGVYYGIGGGGLLTGTIKNNDISDYYMNGITIDAISGYSVSTLIIQDNNIGNIKSTATRLPSGGEVSAGVQLRASGSGTITDVIYDGNTLNPTNKSTITPPSTTYALNSSGVANLRQGSNFILDSSPNVIV